MDVMVFMQHFYPEWNVWQNYVTDNLQSALSLDSLRSSHPVEVPVKRADEITRFLTPSHILKDPVFFV